MIDFVKKIWKHNAHNLLQENLQIPESKNIMQQFLIAMMFYELRI